MAPEEICELLKSKFDEAIEDTVLEGGHPYAVVSADRWPEAAEFLRNDERLGFNLLRCISTLDLIADDRFACVYDLMRIPPVPVASRGLPTGRDSSPPAAPIADTHEFAVRVVVDRNDPVIPSVAHVWPAAEWHEREAYDLMGIKFTGHPGLRRILCPDDWEGHPLRKDYEFPLEYHGIPATTEYELPNPRH